MSDLINIPTKFNGDKLTAAELNTIVNKTNDAITEQNQTKTLHEQALVNKVDKVAGKGLSTEDFTTDEKDKLAGVAAGANNYDHPATHPLSMITETETLKVMTAAERTKLDGLSEHDKGFFANEAAIVAAIPAGQAGWFVRNGETDTVWVWDVEGSGWVDTGSAGGGSGVISVTYSELIDLISDSDLIVGQLYLISDYRTIHNMLSAYSVQIFETNEGIAEPLLVRASGVNSLSPLAISTIYTQDVIHYDWNPSNWIKDKAFSNGSDTIISGFRGVITFRHDTLNDNYTPYDFRHVKFRRWKLNIPEYSSVENYSSKFIVKYESDWYVSLSDSNVGNTPSSTSNSWSKLSHLGLADYADFLCPFPYSSNTLAINQTDGPSSLYADYLTFDCSEADYKLYCKNNHFDGATNITMANSILLNNIIHGIGTNNYCFNNTFEAAFNNIFMNACQGFQSGSEMHSNVFIGRAQACFTAKSCYGNIFGSFAELILGSRISSNIIGIGCNGSHFGTSFENNVVANGNIGVNYAPYIYSKIFKKRPATSSTSDHVSRSMLIASDKTIRELTIDAATNSVVISDTY